MSKTNAQIALECAVVDGVSMLAHTIVERATHLKAWLDAQDEADHAAKRVDIAKTGDFDG